MGEDSDLLTETCRGLTSICAKKQVQTKEQWSSALLTSNLFVLLIYHHQMREKSIDYRSLKDDLNDDPFKSYIWRIPRPRLPSLSHHNCLPTTAVSIMHFVLPQN